MTESEKIRLLEDAFELEESSLTPETILANLPEYDSMAKLTLIVLADDEFKKKLTGEQIKDFITIGDILTFLG